ncbi:MAG: putative Fe-S cluster assembly protein SufT [Simkaniaceae bacterium]|nr:putative Fe-S cluster assembly protein SufT [Simkaniaceae bacterium]
MNTGEIIRLKRDVEAFIVPSGDKVTLKKEEPVRITQALGGTFTVVLQGNMFQISGLDGDALGFEREETTDEDLEDLKKEVDEQVVWDQLKSVFDPEIPVNIVDLGLIYDLSITPMQPHGSKVHIKMTLTAPGCGMGPVIARDAEQKILAVPGVADVEVELVWEPQWTKDMMSEEAQLQLGLL